MILKKCLPPIGTTIGSSFRHSWSCKLICCLNTVTSFIRISRPHNIAAPFFPFFKLFWYNFGVKICWVPWVSMLYGFNYIMNCDSEFYLFLAFLFSFLTINCDLLHVSPWERLILQQYFKREKTDTNINFLCCSIATFYIDATYIRQQSNRWMMSSQWPAIIYFLNGICTVLL